MFTVDEKQKSVNKKVYNILIEMGQEVAAMVSIHRRSFDSAFKEGQDKWRAFSSRVNKKLGSEVIKPDGFKNYWEQKIPEIKLINGLGEIK